MRGPHRYWLLVSGFFIASIGFAGVNPVIAQSSPVRGAKAWTFTSPDGSVLPGTDVDCIALTNLVRATSAACTLFGPSGSGCDFNNSSQVIGCFSTKTLESKIPPSYSTIPLACKVHCKEFDLSIPGSYFTVPGQWFLVVTFFDKHGNLIRLHPENRSITVKSIFVLPESQVGSISLIATSMLALGGLYYFRKKSAKSEHAL